MLPMTDNADCACAPFDAARRLVKWQNMEKQMKAAAASGK